MAIKARGEFTISVVNDGRGEKTYIRYSDDNGKTFTSFVENGDYGHGRNLFGFNLGIQNMACRVDKTINGYWAVKVETIPKLYYLWKGRSSAMPAGIYRLSGLIRSDGNCTIELRMGGTPAREGSISVNNEWKPFSVTVNNTKALGVPDFGNIETKYLSGTTKVFIKNFMLTMGEDKYDYAPAPEDQDAGTFPGKYIGIMSWDKPYPPLDPSAYTWSAFQGQDAELYKLSPLEESAIVGNDGACKVILRYNVTYITGSKASKYTGDDITIKVDSRLGALNFTKKPTGEWECVTTITNFTTKNLGSFNVSVMKGAQVLDTRVIPVTYATQALMEANQKLGEVVASVRGISKLIHNMLVGSTFLEPIEGVWSMAGAKVDNALKYNNSNVVFIEEHGQAADTYHSLLFNVSGLAPNTAYTVSAMVRTDNLASFTGGNNGAVLEVTQTTKGQRKRLFDPISIVPAKANTWEKFEHTFTTPATLTSEVVEVKFMLLRNGRLWVSQPMMNAGEVAADYTANIKDIQLSLAQIKVTANTISQSVTDLSTGLESVGIHLNGEEKKITLHGDTEMVDASGNHVAMFKDGKMSADIIDADKIVAKGIQSKTIDAKDATFKNVNVSGNINASSGKIAGFKINGDGLTNDPFTNDAYIVFRNKSEKSFAGFGGNVAPPTSGLKAVARFENCYEDDFVFGVNYSVLVSAQGAHDNIAMQIDGGALTGVAMRNTIISPNETSRKLNRFDYNVVAINNNECVITLPEMELHDDGHVVRISRLNNGNVKIVLGNCYTYDGTKSRYSLPYFLLPHIPNGYNGIFSPDDGFTSMIIKDAVEFVWMRDISRTIDGNTYHGAWIVYWL